MGITETNFDTWLILLVLVIFYSTSTVVNWDVTLCTQLVFLCYSLKMWFMN